MKRKLLHVVFNFLLRLLTRLDIQGKENVPEVGACVMVSNHLGMVDAPLVFALLDRKDSTGVVAKKHQKNILLKWIINTSGAIWINREEADTKAIRAIRNFLDEGGIVGIAPEGTRSKTGGLLEGKTGAAYFVNLTDVPVLPAGITGTDNLSYWWKRLKRPPVTIRFGETFKLPQVERSRREEGLRENTEEIMCRIAALLPPDKRGVYANHPRTQELLAEDSSYPN